MAQRTIRATGSPQDARTTMAVLNNLSAAILELQDNFNALLAKLDDDATVTDTDYEATLAAAEEADTVVARF